MLHSCQNQHFKLRLNVCPGSYGTITSKYLHCLVASVSISMETNSSLSCGFSHNSLHKHAALGQLTCERDTKLLWLHPWNPSPPQPPPKTLRKPFPLQWLCRMTSAVHVVCFPGRLSQFWCYSVLNRMQLIFTD